MDDGFCLLVVYCVDDLFHLLPALEMDAYSFPFIPQREGTHYKAVVEFWSLFTFLSFLDKNFTVHARISLFKHNAFRAMLSLG